MAETAVRQLPRGRHGLSREHVEADQRLRIFLGLSEAMAERGYVGTPVADIIKRAGVSRETFYQHHSGKLDAFLTAFDLVGAVVHERLVEALASPASPGERLEQAVDAYLETLAAEPGFARLFLVEVHAAGPEAMARRTAVQQRIVDAFADALDLHDDAGRFACRLVVAGVGALVTGPLVAGDLDALCDLGPSITDHVRRLVASGVLTAPEAARSGPPRRRRVAAAVARGRG